MRHREDHRERNLITIDHRGRVVTAPHTVLILTKAVATAAPSLREGNKSVLIDGGKIESGEEERNSFSKSLFTTERETLLPIKMWLSRTLS